MREIGFSSFKDVTKKLNGREIVLFGAGTISPKTARKLNNNYSFIVDNNPNMWEQVQEGKNVLNPESIKQKSKEYFVIICTTSFIDVSEQLEKFGYEIEKDFIVSPILNDLRIISELEHHQAKILFTSGVPEKDDPKSGGGIYELVLDGHDWEYKKIFSGIYYGLIKYGENYISVDDKKGIIEFDKDYNIVRSKELPQATRAHGIDFSEVTKCFYVVASYRDEILVFNQELEQVNTIKLSNKFDYEGSPAHHCNDLCVVGHSLYVTMFSYSGNWKKDIFDGVVMEVDIITNEIKGAIVSDLWMPHNITFLDGSLTVLDSLRGELKKNNMQTVGKFPAFTRGIDFDGIFYYIGQSRNRNYSKNLGVSLNISIDTGIVVFDEVTKASRMIHLPQKVSEIHSILVI